MYDVRRKCQGPLCYRRFEVLDDYLNRPAVRAALGVGNRTWAACNMVSSVWPASIMPLDWRPTSAPLKICMHGYCITCLCAHIHILAPLALQGVHADMMADWCVGRGGSEGEGRGVRLEVEGVQIGGMLLLSAHTRPSVV